MTQQTTSSRSWTVLAVVGILLALGAGLVAGRYWRGASLPTGDRAAVEKVVHDYILDHPEILPEAMQRMQQRELAARLAPLRTTLENPYPGAVLGNPKGTVTLVEFSDYACPYCRMSVPEVEALIAANKDLKVVMREEAVLSPQSEDAARMEQTVSRLRQLTLEAVVTGFQRAANAVITRSLLRG